MKGEEGKGDAETALPDLKGRALAEDSKIQCFSLWRLIRPDPGDVRGES